MCGINGLILRKPNVEKSVNADLQAMNNLIIHRGPDSEGTVVKSENGITIGMGMRRLSIIDLNSGNQPMFSEDKNIAIVFNGEIYNFKKLKTQLEEKGVNFKTKSDTEVILKLYEAFGEVCFKMLEGMFAFSIYDFNKQKLFIARDFFGEKPLYYTQNNSSFYWASELKSILNCLKVIPQISKEGLNLFFRLTYIPAPYTIYNTVHKLEANSYITYDLNSGALDIYSIHNEKDYEQSYISFKDATSKTRDLVIKSVENRSISDVPLGTFLSGGVDSSIVSLCLSNMSDAKIDTFSIGFEKTSYDETEKSRVVANLINSNHHEFVISESDLTDNIDSILLNFDEPFADSSALPTYLVSNKTKNHVKVALTGDGGDEVFGGYNKYYIGKLNRKYTKIIPEGLHNKIAKISSNILKDNDDARGFKYRLNKLINTIDYTDSYYWNIISLGFTDEEISTFLKPEFQKHHIFDYYKTKTNISNPKSLTDFRTVDRHISLEGDMLVKVDRTSMLNSLECRAPFLNKELFDFAMALPESYLLNGWSKKHILKEAFKNDFPDKFLEKSKKGFGVPVGDWLRKGLKNELLGYSENDFLNKQGIFNTNDIKILVDNHVSGKIDNAFKVWSFFCFQKWYKNTFGNVSLS